MKLSINEILKLDYKEDDFCFIEYELLEKIMGFYTLDGFSHDRITQRKYIDNLVKYDCRARDLNIICVDSEPTLIYQYIGKGEYNNIFIINQDKLNELKELVFEQLHSNEEPLKVVDNDFTIDIETYGTDIYIKDNQLTCNNPQKELVLVERNLTKLLGDSLSEIRTGYPLYIGYINVVYRFENSIKLYLYNDNNNLVFKLIDKDRGIVIKEYPTSVKNAIETLEFIYIECLEDYENKSNYKNYIV